MKFPSMVDWMDEYGMEELHRMHVDFNRMSDEPDLSFSDFVEHQYEENKEEWEDQMNRGKAISVPMHADGEIDLENAKQVMVGVVRHLCENPSIIHKIIDDEDLAPDYMCALHVVDRFWDTVVPGIDLALKKM